MILKKMNVDYVLLPKLNEIYKNKKDEKINLKKKDKIMCAQFRPGHFEGVLAVINQFLKNIKASYIFLGEKDYQQFFLIKKFVRNKFSIKVENENLIFSIDYLDNIWELIDTFFEWTTLHKFDKDKIINLTALIYLNIATLHHHPYDIFLYSYGRFLLGKGICFLDGIKYKKSFKKI